MQQITRLAVYYAPRAGAFADHAAAWLGRDAETGTELPRPDIGLPAEAITVDPARYGFHGTLKPPFRLAPGQTLDALHLALGLLARQLAPVSLPGLHLADLRGYQALVPLGDHAALDALAARVVQDLDPFRAALTPAEIARRRPERLSPNQRALLDRWGYPFVLDEFRFHLTLTDRLDPALAAQAGPALAAHFDPVLPAPFVIEDLCLFGEGPGGQFRILHRYALSG